MHQDFKDLLSAFNARSVRYLIVGGYAYARYTEPRTTKDLDLFLRPDPENALAAYKALAEFGAHLADATPADFAKPGIRALREPLSSRRRLLFVVYTETDSRIRLIGDSPRYRSREKAI
jgi:hypothetical protein